MHELIPSKDVRDYMEKRGRELTDFEKATLIYNHSAMNMAEKTDALRKLLSVTEDAELKKQIQERLEYDQLCMDVFYKKDRKYIYALEVFFHEEAEWSGQGFFESGELAVICGKKFGEHFAVGKVELIIDEKNVDDCDVHCVATMHYKSDGKFDWYWSYEGTWTGEKDEDSKERFENSYIDIVHPFRNGDLVKIKHKEAFEDEICIVECIRDDEEYEENRVKCTELKEKGILYDYTDVSIRVAYVYGYAQFGHKHVSVVNVEYAELDEKHPQKEILESASSLLRGYGGLNDFQVVCDEYCRKKRPEAVVMTPDLRIMP